jgi:exopolysaccharide biosynthesis polyprenyl glycosylphosphotransferase
VTATLDVGSAAPISDGQPSAIPSAGPRRDLLLSRRRFRAEGTSARRAWRSRYVLRVGIGDVVCAVVSAVVGLLVRFGSEQSWTEAQHAALGTACVLPVVWVAAMVLARTYEHRFLWVGAEEFRRVFWASMLLLAAVGTVSWAFKLEVARGFIVVALPLLGLLTLVNRYAQREFLRLRRRQGHYLENIVIVGRATGVRVLQKQIERQYYRGYRVIGCCLPVEQHAGWTAEDTGVPVLGGLEDVSAVVRQYEVDTVAVLPSSGLDGDRVRQLGWELEDTAAELLLAPAVSEVAGPRVGMRPAFGLPLMYVERPELAGHRRLAKDLFDRIVSGVFVVAFSPLLVAVAVGIKLTSRGPVFFRHERVGRNGEPLHVFKFRTMYQGADAHFDSLLEQSEGNAVQFKMRSDPRITSIGRFLRRYSIDELPQLFNVLAGGMSLVGPRPHVTREVEMYGVDMRRRLLVKPGMTGMWQVSGRSDLSWEDSVRADVRYVENWSLSLDLMILAKTVRAVLHGSGAY